MRQKIFTHAYWLIRCNDNMLHSFMQRAKGASLNLSTAGLFFWSFWPLRAKAAVGEL